MSRPIHLLLLLAIVGVAGCDRIGDHKVGKTLVRAGSPAVTSVEDDDAEMTAAIDKARGTVQDFLKALQAPELGQTDFAVKAPFADGEHGEHMWVGNLRYVDGEFTGRLDNEPVSVTTVRLGQRVSVNAQEISDWMYSDRGRLVGGYSFRVLRNKMSPEERKIFDAQVPFRIED